LLNFRNRQQRLLTRGRRRGSMGKLASRTTGIVAGPTAALDRT
jgi:hypothetical protein